MRVRLLVPIVLLVALLGAACLPPAPGPTGGNDPDGWAAVDHAFARFGPGVTATAHCIAQRESHHGAGATNGQYRGIFQLGPHYAGSIEAAAVTLGRAPDFYDGWVNAWAASIIYEQSGWRPWSTAPGCT